MKRRTFLKLAGSGLFVPRLLRGQAYTFFDPQIYVGRRAPGPTGNLLAYWKLDDAGFPLIDSVAGNYGLSSIDTTFTAQAGGVINQYANSTTYSGFYATGTAGADFAAGAGVSFACSGWYWAIAAPPSTFYCYKWDGTTDALREWHMGPSAAGGNPQLNVRDLTNADVSVTAVASVGAYWTHIAFGYDAAAGVIWIQVNGGARVTQACSGVRSTASTFWLGGGGAGGLGISTRFDEVGFWKRSLSSAEVIALYNNGNGWAYPFDVSRGNQIANVWAAQVVTNGGASPSSATTAALGAFVDTIMAAGTSWYKMIAVNAVVPDSLIAACTPLVANGGSALWANHNFVAGDLTVNGLIGNGSTKYLDTGFAANAFISANSAGFTVYYDTYVNEGAVELLAADASAHQVGVYLWSGVLYFDCFNTTPAEISAALTTGGYVSGNRIASNSFDIYFANSGNAHASLAHGTAAPGTAPAKNFFAWCGNINGTPNYFSSKRLSFVAIHNGLTTAESLAFYNAIQALRTALGGGAI